MTTTDQSSAHQIYVNGDADARFPFEARCICGWTSPRALTREQAVNVAAWHAPSASHPATGPVECAPWCKYGDGHADATFREDQWCGSELLRVDMTLRPPLQESRLSDDGRRYVPGPDYLEVYAFHNAGETEPKFRVMNDDCDVLLLSRGEAGQLVEALQLLLGMTAGEA